jgi:LPXTG-site transpeptidase (sortase) family protein
VPVAAAGALALTGGGLVLAHAADPPPVRIGIAEHAPLAEAAAPAASAPATGAPAAPPVRLVIPSIGLDAPVAAGGLNSDGTVQTPPLDQPGLVDWYQGGPAPGEVGPAVLLGHVNTRQGPAVFSRLPQLQPGDRIDIHRQDGSTVSYRVRQLQQFPKSNFPTELVYGNTDNPQLRLITCGGTLQSDGHYSDNIIVLADLVTS